MAFHFGQEISKLEIHHPIVEVVALTYAAKSHFPMVAAGEIQLLKKNGLDFT